MDEPDVNQTKIGMVAFRSLKYKDMAQNLEQMSCKCLS